MRPFLFLSLCFVLIYGSACPAPHSEANIADTGTSADALQMKTDSSVASDSTALPENTPSPIYRFPIRANSYQHLADRFAPPAGFNRVEVPSGSYAEWLRYLPLYPQDRQVYLHNGQLKSNQSVHEAVIKIDVGRRDLQQCADAVMRLRAEYLYAVGNLPDIHFNYTSGDQVAFTDWSKGKKPVLQGNQVRFTAPTSTIDTSYRNFRAYMNNIFAYAGTASLAQELESVALADIRAGDIFIQGGYPGHAVIVLDVARHSDGRICFMLAQSYMPAQDIHVLRNPQDPGRSPWYGTEFGEKLITPEWTFKPTDLARFK